MAPAAFGQQLTSLEKAREIPLLLLQGDNDILIPTSITQQWADKAKELKMEYERKVFAGVDHSGVITAGMPDVFRFFGKHTKPEAK